MANGETGMARPEISSGNNFLVLQKLKKYRKEDITET